MNKFQKIGVAIIFASGVASAGLWTVNAPYGQVQFPWVVECTTNPDGSPKETFDQDDPNDPCYKTKGGWWFGYVAGWEGTGEVGPKACIGAPGMPPDGGSKSGVNGVTAKIDGNWVNFNGADFAECEGPAITDKSNGYSLMSPDGLEIRLKIGGGYIDKTTDTYEPSLAGIGVNFGEYPTAAAEKDLKDKNGFCLTYQSDHANNSGDNAGADLALVLGWDEGIKGNLVKGFDVWYVKIPESQGQKVTKEFTWNGQPQVFVAGISPPDPNEAGMFIQDNWTSWASNYNKPTSPGPFPIDDATKKMTSVKIRLSGYEAQTVNFKLIEFGFTGTCNGGGTPIIGGTPRAVNPVSFALSGKTLSLNSSAGKPLAVQVINLQGSIVQTKTMSNGDKMNLQNLPTGIYIVRVPSMGYVAKYTIK